MLTFHARLRRVTDRLGRLLTEEVLRELGQIRIMTERTAMIAKEQYVAQILNTARYLDPKRLERYASRYIHRTMKTE
jgi:hypothetical protein